MASPRASANRYAEAVLAIASDDRTFDAWLQDLERIQRVLADPAAGRVLTSPTIPEGERLAGLFGLLPDLRPETRKFAALLVERGRLELITDIREELKRLVDEARGIVVAEVTSAVPLDARQREVVAGRLARYTGKQVHLDTAVDPDLIGGIVARIGDERIDDSIRGRLQRLKERLIQA